MARRFQFSLETLLKIRRLREREAQRKVGAQRAAIARLDEADAAGQEEIRRQQGALLNQQEAGGVDARALARGWAWIGAIRREMAQRQLQREDMQRVLAQLQDGWRTARKQTRIIEKLRERRWEEHRHDLQRREQAQMDEVALRLHSDGVTEFALPEFTE